MAPEAPNRKIRRELDIYSLGVVIAEILTRQKGYPAVENVRTFRDHTMMKVFQFFFCRNYDLNICTTQIYSHPYDAVSCNGQDIKQILCF